MSNPELELSLIENKKKTKRKTNKNNKHDKLKELYDYLDTIDINTNEFTQSLDDCIYDLSINFIKLFRVLKRINGNNDYTFVKEIVYDIIEKSLDIEDKIEEKKILKVSEFTKHNTNNINLIKKY